MSVTGFVVVEHKTTAQDIGPGSPYWRRLTIDGQVSNYLRGARGFGVHTRTVLYDVVRKVALRPFEATPEEQRAYTQPKSRVCPECKRKKGATPAPHRVELDDEEAADGKRAIVCHEGRLVTDPGGKLYANMREEDETPEAYRARVREDIGASPDKYFQRGAIVRLESEEADAMQDAWDVGRQIRESELLSRWPRNPDACDSYGSLCAYFDVCTGVASIDDPTRFRDSGEHEELEGAPDGKRRLPLLTTSSAKTFRLCPRKFFYAYRLRRRSIGDAKALRFGSLFHLALESWWTSGDLGEAIARMREAYTRFETDWIDAIRAEELLLGYHARWLHEPLRVVAVEKEFRVPLVNPATGAASKTWDLGGKIDAIAEVLETNEGEP